MACLSQNNKENLTLGIMNNFACSGSKLFAKLIHRGLTQSQCGVILYESCK